MKHFITGLEFVGLLIAAISPLLLIGYFCIVSQMFTIIFFSILFVVMIYYIGKSINNDEDF